MVRMYYQSQKSIGAGNGPDRRLGGIEDEANCKRLTKWRNITLAVLQYTIYATENIKSKLKCTLESFFLRERLSIVTILSWYRIERVVLAVFV